MSAVSRLLPSPAAAHNAERPLSAWPEAAVLALIGDAIGPRYPLGSASRWHRAAGSVAEKRLAEAIAGIVESATGEDRLTRRVAIEGAATAASHAPALPPRLIGVAFNAGIITIDREIALLTDEIAAIRKTQRSPAEQLLLSARRRDALTRAREFDREAEQTRGDCFDVERGGLSCRTAR